MDRNPLIFGGADHGSPPRPWSNVWEGWWPILHALQVVRVADGARGETDAAVADAVRATARTCELCGAPGERRDEPPGRWIKTLCAAHAPPDEVDRWTAGGIA